MSLKTCCLQFFPEVNMPGVLKLEHLTSIRVDEAEGFLVLTTEGGYWMFALKAIFSIYVVSE